MYICFYKTDICAQCGIVNYMGLEYLPAVQINIQSEHMSLVCSHQLVGVLCGAHRLGLAGPWAGAGDLLCLASSGIYLVTRVLTLRGIALTRGLTTGVILGQSSWVDSL